ncbi:RNA-directed DNA polymerase, eukaryota, reverse transcriptase zinc-binding domain protein [Tanacetum coccineum]
MYLVVAMDSNNQILPLAYGVGKSETFRSWDWFLTKLKECIIGKQDNVTIISDGAGFIALAIKNVFPDAFHGLGKSSLPRIDEHQHELTTGAKAKIAKRIAKSAMWTVRPAANYIYNFVDYNKNGTIDLNTRACSYGQWQLSSLPSGHLIADICAN